MKKIILIVAILSLTGLAFAQNDNITPKSTESVQEMTFEFVKKVSPTANGMSTYLYGSPDDIEAVIEEQFRNGANAKAKGLKGVQSFEGVIFPDISPLTLDYYYRLEEDKNHPGKTRIMFFVSAGNYNFMDSEKYPEVMKASKLWVVGLDKAARLLKVNQQVEAQLAVVAKSTEELAKIAEEGQKLIKEKNNLNEEIQKLQAKLADTEKEIATNNEAQAKQQSEMEVEQVKLTTLQKKLDRLK